MTDAVIAAIPAFTISPRTFGQEQFRCPPNDNMGMGFRLVFKCDCVDNAAWNHVRTKGGSHV
jgi:hypothetical protein